MKEACMLDSEDAKFTFICKRKNTECSIIDRSVPYGVMHVRKNRTIK